MPNLIVRKLGLGLIDFDRLASRVDEEFDFALFLEPAGSVSVSSDGIPGYNSRSTTDIMNQARQESIVVPTVRIPWFWRMTVPWHFSRRTEWRKGQRMAH